MYHGIWSHVAVPRKRDGFNYLFQVLIAETCGDDAAGCSFRYDGAETTPALRVPLYAPSPVKDRVNWSH